MFTRILIIIGIAALILGVGILISKLLKWRSSNQRIARELGLDRRR